MHQVKDYIGKFSIETDNFNQLTQLLHQFLPLSFRPHAVVANFRHHQLIILTDSPAWATKLRQLSPQILDFFHQYAPTIDATMKIHHLKIYTRTRYKINDVQQPSNKIPLNRNISPSVAKSLKQLAETVTYSPLKEALLKISKHTKKHG